MRPFSGEGLFSLSQENIRKHTYVGKGSPQIFTSNVKGI